MVDEEEGRERKKGSGLVEVEVEEEVVVGKERTVLRRSVGENRAQPGPAALPANVMYNQRQQQP